LQHSNIFHFRIGFSCSKVSWVGLLPVSVDLFNPI
jgi:hypothetical protein